ncbi:monofunctional biosynthetic peptidoglycan transglycosylase [Pacificimonas sp. WHA3]|uniref:Biosynthetic peptidoglycan transglycosylase n=1 Tax=Pacificimonas pallii TaxID=2827236 RepID=A0ABS6S9Z7_9SPHN|nr:monofunctional biosynthetic peptidoglycan transglycosylase [Pacificimonas pallii]MBV7255174.1 monofunctional biosynthetic peptidoglycan transglycosylase [Pacificimonas pallii]
MAKRKRRSAGKRARKRGFRPFRFLGKMILTVFLLTLVWAGIYRFVPVPATSIMVRDWTSGTGVTKDWVPMSRISPNMPRAVIGAEDAKFCEHWGFDVEAIEKAMQKNEQGGRLRGASTISQQTAKNVFLWPGRNMVRKGLEAYFTGLIELAWGKHRIMEVYLNVAEFDAGVYGVEAASRHYFSKSAKDLTRREAARLAAILPDPVGRSASNPGPYTTRYASRIERWIPIVDGDGQDSCLGM